MSMVILKDSAAVLTADLNTLGAAIKILVAGGTSLSEADARRISGASVYLWKEKGDAILALVHTLQCER